MLDGAFTSPKIRRLAAILGVPWPHALGLCGLLWRFTAKHAPTGEIGTHDDEEIAAALEWPGETEPLIEALVRCKLLDEVDGPARLVVHDWPDHAPRYVLATLRRKGEHFSGYYRPRQADTPDTSADETTDGTTVGTSYSSSSSSSYSYADTARIAWDNWVDGRKTGTSAGIAEAQRSIEEYARKHGITEHEACEVALQRTEEHAGMYREMVRTRKMMLKFVPLAGTFFRQRRWWDPVEHKNRDGIDDEIKRIRAMG